MYHIIVALTFISIALKWGDWRNWELYYPTIAFWIIGDSLYGNLTYNKPLWLYYSPTINHTLLDLIWRFIVFPCVSVVFLYRFPTSNRRKQVGHYLLWIAFFVIIEAVLSWLGYIGYYNCWNIWWSIGFDCLMFPLLKLHYENPLKAWIASIAIGMSIIIVFKIPVLTLR